MMLYALVCRFFCGEEWARSGSSCYPFDVVVISYPVNKKTTATNGGSFAGIQSYQLFLPKVTGGDQIRVTIRILKDFAGERMTMDQIDKVFTITSGWIITGTDLWRG